MADQPILLLVLDLAGTFVFALDGALVALRVARLDIVGAITLGMVTAIGGGIIRDLLIGAVPPATFSDWRYLTVATAGGLIAFLLGSRLERLAKPITVLDAAGLSLFAVTGASKALAFGLGAGQAIILGAITAVGGGTLRDVLVRRSRRCCRAGCTPSRRSSAPPSRSPRSAEACSARSPPSRRQPPASSSGWPESATASTRPTARASALKRHRQPRAAHQLPGRSVHTTIAHENTSLDAMARILLRGQLLQGRSAGTYVRPEHVPGLPTLS